MGNQDGLSRYHQFIAMGRAGRREDVNFLMEVLDFQNDIATSKLVDYALSLVATTEGIQRLRFFLFNGTQVQRNIAALFFKRRGNQSLLMLAVEAGKIDTVQAFAE